MSCLLASAPETPISSRVQWGRRWAEGGSNAELRLDAVAMPGSVTWASPFFPSMSSSVEGALGSGRTMNNERILPGPMLGVIRSCPRSTERADPAVPRLKIKKWRHRA